MNDPERYKIFIRKAKELTHEMSKTQDSSLYFSITKLLTKAYSISPVALIEAKLKSITLMISKLNLEEPNPDPIQEFIDTVEGKNNDVSSGSASPSYPTKRIQKLFSFFS